MKVDGHYFVDLSLTFGAIRRISTGVIDTLTVAHGKILNNNNNNDNSDVVDVDDVDDLRISSGGEKFVT